MWKMLSAFHMKIFLTFQFSTAAGHASQLVYGDLAGKKVLILGPFHYYEGYDLNTVTYPVRIFKELGVETVIVTNAAVGINIFQRGLNDYHGPH